MSTFQCIAPDVKLGQDVKLSKFINLYGCEIGDETKSAPSLKSKRTPGSASDAKYRVTPSFVREFQSKIMYL